MRGVFTGKFGFVDSAGARNGGDKLVVAEMTVRAGAVVWDLNGLAAPDWHGFQYRRRTP